MNNWVQVMQITVAFGKVMAKLLPTTKNKQEWQKWKVDAERAESIFNYGVPLSVLSDEVEEENYQTIDIFNTTSARPYISKILLDNNIVIDSSSSRVLLSEYSNKRYYFSGTVSSIELADNINQVRVLFKDVIVGHELGNENIKSDLLYYDHMNLFCDSTQLKKLKTYTGARMKALGKVKIYHRAAQKNGDTTKHSTGFDNIEIL